MIRHPAHAIPFDLLLDGLQESMGKGLVFEKIDKYGLSLFCYTKECAHSRAWDRFTTVARGLILDRYRRKLHATPFPKFFNYGEVMSELPDEPFDVEEKTDGTLIIAYEHPILGWDVATKGSFNSDQARWARENIDLKRLSPFLRPGATYLIEGVYRENRIVVNYDFEGPVLLAGYDHQGYEISRVHLEGLADCAGWRIARRVRDLRTLKQILTVVSRLPNNQEGYVVRFQSGLRVKFKGDEYCRIHRLISRVTPLAVWEALVKGDNLDDLPRQLPEEFQNDFYAIKYLLLERMGYLMQQLHDAHEKTKRMSDKELGLIIDKMESPVVRAQLFAYRKRGGKLSAERVQWIWRHMRPTGNKLDGYTPTTAMNRFQKDKE